LRSDGIFNEALYYKSTAKSAGERIFEIGEHLANLQATKFEKC